MVAAGPVHVPVGELFLGGRADRGDLDIEVQILAGEWMVAIERHEVPAHLSDRHGARPLRGLGLKPHADARIADALERAQAANVVIGGAMTDPKGDRVAIAMSGKFLPFKYYGATGNALAYGLKEE